MSKKTDTLPAPSTLTPEEAFHATGAVNVDFDAGAAPKHAVDLSRTFIKPCEGMAKPVWFLPLARSVDVREFYRDTSLNPNAPLYMWAGVLLADVAPGAGCFRDGEPAAGKKGTIVYTFEQPVFAHTLATCKANGWPIGIMANRKVPRKSRKEGGRVFQMWDWKVERSPSPIAIPSFIHTMFALPDPNLGAPAAGALPPASDVLDVEGQEVPA